MAVNLLCVLARRGQMGRVITGIARPPKEGSIELVILQPAVTGRSVWKIPLVLFLPVMPLPHRGCLRSEYFRLEPP